MIEQHVFVAF